MKNSLWPSSNYLASELVGAPQAPFLSEMAIGYMTAITLMVREPNNIMTSVELIKRYYLIIVITE
jgi:hypothetical protein